MQINVGIPNLEGFSNALENYPELANPLFETAIEESLGIILTNIEDDAPIGVSGDLAQNWAMVVSDMKGSLISGVAYGAYVESGTRPHFPPISAITPWANQMGIPPWALAISISKKGTAANPFASRAIAAAGSGISHQFSIALNAILQELAISAED